VRLLVAQAAGDEPGVGPVLALREGSVDGLGGRVFANHGGGLRVQSVLPCCKNRIKNLSVTNVDLRATQRVTLNASRFLANLQCARIDRSLSKLTMQPR